jgi:hypothetical protein
MSSYRLRETLRKQDEQGHNNGFAPKLENDNASQSYSWTDRRGFSQRRCPGSHSSFSTRVSSWLGTRWVGPRLRLRRTLYQQRHQRLLSPANGSDPIRTASAYDQRLRLRQLLSLPDSKTPIASAVGVFWSTIFQKSPPKSCACLDPAMLAAEYAASLLFVDEGHGVGDAGSRGAVTVGLVVAVGESE